jgi:hypothetical protein
MTAARILPIGEMLQHTVKCAMNRGGVEFEVAVPAAGEIK